MAIMAAHNQDGPNMMCLCYLQNTCTSSFAHIGAPYTKTILLVVFVGVHIYFMIVASKERYFHTEFLRVEIATMNV